MYIAYYEDNYGHKMSSSFGWSDNKILAEMFLRTHRLSKDKDCTPCLEEVFYESTDTDDIYCLFRGMDFYPYTPDVNCDSKIQVISIADNEFNDELSVITTVDTLCNAVGSNVARVVSECEAWRNDYSNGYMEYDSNLMNAERVCRIIHWLATGKVFKDSWSSSAIIRAIETISKYNMVSYQDFDSIRYCINTGYLIPVK